MTSIRVAILTTLFSLSDPSWPAAQAADTPAGVQSGASAAVQSRAGRGLRAAGQECRAEDPPQFFLRFPLPNRTPYNAAITAVFDHSTAEEEEEEEEEEVVAFTGERGRGRPATNGFDIGFLVSGLYSGAGENPKILWYNGHTGIDYTTRDQPPGTGLPEGVYRFRPGKGDRIEIEVNSDGSARCLAGDCERRIAVFAAARGRISLSNDKYATVTVDHGNGFRTKYLHMNQPEQRPFFQEADCVDAGQVIGISSDIGLDSKDTFAFAHLHFEVERIQSNGVYMPVDPYGWQGQYPDPLVPSVQANDPGGKQRSTSLWKPATEVAPFVRWHPDGSLITHNGVYYIIEGGQKRGIPSTEVFYAYGLDFSKGVTTTPDALNCMPDGPILEKPPEPRLVNDSGTFYEITDRARTRGIPSPAVLLGQGFDPERAVDGSIAGFNPDPNIVTYRSPFRDGTLLCRRAGAGPGAPCVAGETVYLVSNSKLVPFASEQAFRALGHRFEDVTPVSSQMLDEILGDIPVAQSPIDIARLRACAGDLPRTPGAVAVNPASGNWTSSPQEVSVSSPGASGIYYSIRYTVDGTTPPDPDEPALEAHDGVIRGDAGSFSIWAGAGQRKHLKVRFRGENAAGYGPASPVYSYVIDASRPSGLQVRGIEPGTPTAGPNDQRIKVTGSGFQRGLTVMAEFPSGLTTVLGGPQIQNVTDTSFWIYVTFGSPGTWRIRVDNPDGQQSGFFSFTVQSAPAISATIQVPGKADILLAGQPPEVPTPRGNDKSPEHSPVLVPLQIAAGQTLRFNATGLVDLDGRVDPQTPPDGGSSDGCSSVRSFGISRIEGPCGALVGVFLGPQAPSPAAYPVDLAFKHGARELTVLRPRLQQPFYIGSGLNRIEEARNLIVPEGATRLFLAVLDYSGYNNNNTGFFSVAVTIVPGPAPELYPRVYGVSNITLAGAPDGREIGGSSINDSSPLQSPVEVPIQFSPGQTVQVSATGFVGLYTSAPNTPPEGSSESTSTGRNFGISSVRGPRGGLIGLFLGPQAPTPAAYPVDLDFRPGARDLTVLKPRLHQPFWIGSGSTTSGESRNFIVPQGATRLFLGVLVSGGNNYTNSGFFSVSVNIIPGPPPELYPRVYGSSNITLAGAPDGRAVRDDSSPLQSPVEVPLALRPGQTVEVSATGLVGPSYYGPDTPPTGTYYNETTQRDFGISRITGPAYSLIGLFLGPGAPNPGLLPPDVDFSQQSARDAVRLTPMLQQPFYIGSGTTRSGDRRSFVVPQGATRLFLGVLTSPGGNSGTVGFFVVNVGIQ
jgi:hypothetical protein